MLCIPVSAKQSIKFTVLVKSHHVDVSVDILSISVSAKQSKILVKSHQIGVFVGMLCIYLSAKKIDKILLFSILGGGALEQELQTSILSLNSRRI